MATRDGCRETVGDTAREKNSGSEISLEMRSYRTNRDIISDMREAGPLIHIFMIELCVF